MESRSRPAGAAQCGCHLDEAAGVAARIGVREGCEHVRGLAVAELRGGARLDDVVDAGAATADLLFGWVEPLEAGDRIEHRAGRVRQSLRVTEAARVLESDPQRQRAPLRPLLGEQ